MIPEAMMKLVFRNNPLQEVVVNVYDEIIKTT